MGLFDDFIDLAKEFSDIKDEVVGTASDAVKEVTSLKDEALDTKDTIINGVKDTLQGKSDQTE